MGRVSNLRVVESLGSTVRLGWTGVAGATQYRIIILNTEGMLSDFIHSFIVFILIYLAPNYERKCARKNGVSACFMSCQ